MRPMNDPTGAIRICRRHFMTCWVHTPEDYAWSLEEAIRIHPDQRIHAGWTYGGHGNGGIWEDRTRYTSETGRQDFQRMLPLINTKG